MQQIAPPTFEYNGAAFIWDMVRTSFETGNISFRSLADMYGFPSATIQRRCDKEEWVRDLVRVAAQAGLEVKDKIEEHREAFDLADLREYNREVNDTIAVIEKTRERHANNNWVNSNNMGIMIGQLAEFLSNVNVLDQKDMDGNKLCDTGAFVKLVSAVRNLNMDEKKPDVAVNVNNQVNIMDDIAGQHQSIYDDVEYKKDA